MATTTNPSKIFDVTPDWPRKGVNFFSMNPWLQNFGAIKKDSAATAKRFSHLGITHIAYLGARGFLLTQLSQLLETKTVIIRKEGEMPPPYFEETYSGEYRKDVKIILRHGDVQEGARVLIVDDVLATGGTAVAAVKLVEKAGGRVIGLAFLSELDYLGGRQKLLTEQSDLVITSNYLIHADGSFQASPPFCKFIIPGRCTTLDLPSVGAEDDRAVVMWHDSVVEQAQLLVKQFPNHFVASPIKSSRFPDGHYDMEFNPDLVGKHLVYVMSLLKPEEVGHQYALAIALARQHIKSFTILLTYYAPGTKERVDKLGEVATAQTTAQLITKSLEAIPMMGPTTVIIYDIHTMQEQFYFGDACSLALRSTSSLMGGVVKREKMVVVFPDQGAYKRFGKEPDLSRAPTLICNKERGPNDSRQITICDRKNCQGITDEKLHKRHVVIYDDIGHSGGTCWETFLTLKALGYQKISLYVTHAVFSEQAWMRFLPSGDRAGFHRIYTTNSVPSLTERYFRYYPDTFTVLDLTPLTGDFIIRKYNIEASKIAPHISTWYNTSSQPKHDAIASVFPNALAFPDYVLPEDSDVNPQPFGSEEMIKGARNRMEALRKNWKSLSDIVSHPWGRVSILVTVESGICADVSGTIMRDQTVVLYELHNPDGRSTRLGMVENVSEFNGPLIPEDVMKAVVASKFKKTAGEIICKQYPLQNCDPVDWYKVKLTDQVKPHPYSRREVITSMMEIVLADAIDFLREFEQSD